MKRFKWKTIIIVVIIFFVWVIGAILATLMQPTTTIPGLGRH